MRTWSDEVHPESWTLKCASPTLAVSGWAFSVPCFVGRSSRRLLQRRVPKLVSFVEPSMDDPSIGAYGTRLAIHLPSEGQGAANFSEGPAYGRITRGVVAT